MKDSKKIQIAHIAVEAVAQEKGVSLVGAFYKKLILPVLVRSTESLGGGFPTYRIDSNMLSIEYSLVSKDDPLVEWSWQVFNILTFGMLSDNKMRRLSLSNIGCMSENIMTIRRMLLVDSPTNPNYVYDKFAHNDLNLTVSTGEEFKSLPFTKQIDIAGNLLYHIITFIICNGNPKLLESQLQCVNASDMSLVLWGNFKNKKIKKS